MKRFSLVVLAVLAGSWVVLADEEKKPNTRNVIITALDLTQGTLSARLNADGGGVSDYNLLRDTSVTIDGKQAKLADLKVGLRAEITTKPGGDDIVAVIVLANANTPPRRVPTARGAIKSIDPKAREIVLTIRGDGNRIFDNSYPLAPEVAVLRGKETAELKDLKPGDEVIMNLGEDRRTAVKIVVSTGPALKK